MHEAINNMAILSIFTDRRPLDRKRTIIMKNYEEAGTHMIYQTILLFTLYSFLGWVSETVYCSVPAGKFINRGFLNGPFCPVYGIGALLVVSFLKPFQSNILLLFLCGIVVTSVLEYITAFLLEKMFHTKWWDYSEHKFNIHGRVCLLNSVLFGILSVFVMEILHPFLLSMLEHLPEWTVIGLTAGFSVYFIVDTVITVRSILQLNEKLEKLHGMLDELTRHKEAYKEKLHNKLTDLDQETRAAAQQKINKLSAALEEFAQNNKFSYQRLLQAFPHMKSIRHTEMLEKIKNAVKSKLQERK